MEKYIRPFREINSSATADAGGKLAALAEIYNNVDTVNVPGGFAITTDAYNFFIQSNAIEATLQQIFNNLDRENFRNLEQVSEAAKRTIINARFPIKLEFAVSQAYNAMFDGKAVAVRGSIANAASTAVQCESFVNIKGPVALMYAIKCTYASLYSTEAIMYRENNNIDHTTASVAIGIQQMVRADVGCSGIAYTSKDRVTIKGNWGLGQNFKLHAIQPDVFVLNKTNPALISTTLGSKNKILIYNELAAGTNSTVQKITPAELRAKLVLTPTEAEMLKEQTIAIESYCKQTIYLEWAKDGTDGKLYILQAQPAYA